MERRASRPSMEEFAAPTGRDARASIVARGRDRLEHAPWLEDFEQLLYTCRVHTH